MRQRRAIAGRVVAITGGARGIGRATAETLAERGARVVIGDVDHAAASRTAEALGEGVSALPVDVADRGLFTRFLDQVEDGIGPLDVLINNAGIMPIARLDDESDRVTERILAVNVHGVVVGSKLALARMRSRGSGHIVNVASQAGRAGFGGLATYCASKYAVVGFSAALDDELRGSGISVSCVMPGVVETELAAGITAPRLVRAVRPDEVAAAIAGVLERPRLNVHVPPMAVTIGLFGLLPALPRRLIARLVAGERVALGADLEARAPYEERVAEGAGGN